MAKDLYVNSQTGDDSVTYQQNDSAHPWRSLERAAWGGTVWPPTPDQAAQAGDTVHVTAGTYACGGSQSRYHPAFAPCNSGTASQPIVFVAEGPVVGQLSSGAGPVFGVMSQSYIEWRGPFIVREAQAPSVTDTGPVVLYNCHHVLIDGMEIDGEGVGNQAQDNHTGVRLADASDITLRNLLIRNVRTQHNVNNGAAIMSYDSRRMTIEHCDIADCGSGVFFKGNDDQPDGNLVRYNRIDNCAGAAICLHINPADAPCIVEHNLITRCGQGLRIWGLVPTSPTAQVLHLRFRQNTVHDCNHGLSQFNNAIANADHEYRQNLVTSSRTATIYTLSGVETFEPGRQRYVGNWYHGAPLFARINAEDSNAVTLANFAAWRARFPGYDTDGGDANPQYVDTATGNFRLQPGSPAQGRGAYVTGQEIIGRGGSAEPPPVPVDCQVSDWSEWGAWSSWTAINETREYRTRTRTRTIRQQPEHGGEACPHLSELERQERGRCVTITGTVGPIGPDNWTHDPTLSIVAILIDGLGAVHYRTRGLTIPRADAEAWEVRQGQRFSMTFCPPPEP